MTFKLPKWGGAMVHSDPQMTDFIDLPVPKKNVDIVWHRSELKGEKAGSIGCGMAGNGKIAACTYQGLKDNLVIYDYNGEHLWTSGEMLNAIAVSSTPMVSINNEAIACDNKTILMVKSHKDEFWTEWISDIPFEGTGVLFPFSPTIVKDKIIILPTKNGPVYAYNAQTGELLAKKYLGSFKENNKEFYSTINSACVNNNRLYITTGYSKSIDLPNGRLYALDVNPDTEDESELLTEAWYYPFNGISQASPLFIDDTIYFDGYRRGIELLKKPRIYAITDKGERYKACSVQYPNRTLFSFSKDPRGGFWYEDTRGRKLVRFKKEGERIHIKDKIFIKNIVPGGLDIYKPLSCMTICDKKEPVMLISAITYFFKKYIIAVKLDNDDSNKQSVLWTVKLADFGINFAGGQFTILKKDDNPDNNRIVFGTVWDGAMAIGSVD